MENIDKSSTKDEIVESIESQIRKGTIYGDNVESIEPTSKSRGGGQLPPSGSEYDNLYFDAKMGELLAGLPPIFGPGAMLGNQSF